MRYEDWDILLFPRDCKVPLKEFKVACHVVQDNEFSHIHGSLGLPTVCCFVPSLAPGAPYKLSIHSWSTPPISQFSRSVGKFADRVVFEARLFVDGQLVATSSMDRAGPWPNVLKTSFDVAENGELGFLSFPNFQREILNQSYWSPADDFGRIKLVISESYPRDSLTMPLERLKNVIAFSFQHAPLEILESSAIAWPNPSMWRTMPFTSSIPSRNSDDGRSHAHSPRPRFGTLTAQPSFPQAAALPQQAVRPRSDAKVSVPCLQNVPATSGTPATDPFVEANAYFEWLNGIGMGTLAADSGLSTGVQSTSKALRKSSTDTSMPDYMSSSDQTPLQEKDDDNIHNHENDSAHMKVPTNTPTACDLAATQTDGVPFPIFSSNTPVSSALDDTPNSSFLSHSTATPPLLVPTPAMEVKSRKENQSKKYVPSPSISETPSAVIESVSIRKVSQQLYSAGTGTMATNTVGINGSPHRCSSKQSTASNEKPAKRLRNFTPSSNKAFDEDEEPSRASPRLRLTPFDETATA